MTEWQAIGWVLGGIVSAVLFTITVSGAVKKWKDKIKSEALEEEREEKSLDANWKKTRQLEQGQIDLAEIVNSIESLVKDTNYLIRLIISSRNSNLDREKLKYDASRALVKHHLTEGDKFLELSKRFDDLEKREEEEKLKPIVVPDK